MITLTRETTIILVALRYLRMGLGTHQVIHYRFVSGVLADLGIKDVTAEEIDGFLMHLQTGNLTLVLRIPEETYAAQNAASTSENS